jgi:hypothetical protein
LSFQVSSPAKKHVPSEALIEPYYSLLFVAIHEINDLQSKKGEGGGIAHHGLIKLIGL